MNAAKRIFNSFLGIKGPRQTGEAQRYLAAQVKEFTRQAANSPDKPLEDRLSSSARRTSGSAVKPFVVLSRTAN